MAKKMTKDELKELTRIARMVWPSINVNEDESNLKNWEEQLTEFIRLHSKESELKNSNATITIEELGKFNEVSEGFSKIAIKLQYEKVVAVFDKFYENDSFETTRKHNVCEALTKKCIADKKLIFDEGKLESYIKTHIQQLAEECEKEDGTKALAADLKLVNKKMNPTEEDKKKAEEEKKKTEEEKKKAEEEKKKTEEEKKKAEEEKKKTEEEKKKAKKKTEEEKKKAEEEKKKINGFKPIEGQFDNLKRVHAMAYLESLLTLTSNLLGNISDPKVLNKVVGLKTSLEGAIMSDKPLTLEQFGVLKANAEKLLLTIGDKETKEQLIQANKEYTASIIKPKGVEKDGEDEKDPNQPKDNQPTPEQEVEAIKKKEQDAFASHSAGMLDPKTDLKTILVKVHSCEKYIEEMDTEKRQELLRATCTYKEFEKQLEKLPKNSLEYKGKLAEFKTFLERTTKDGESYSNVLPELIAKIQTIKLGNELTAGLRVKTKDGVKEVKPSSLLTIKTGKFKDLIRDEAAYATYKKYVSQYSKVKGFEEAVGNLESQISAYDRQIKELRSSKKEDKRYDLKKLKLQRRELVVDLKRAQKNLLGAANGLRILSRKDVYGDRAMLRRNSAVAICENAILNGTTLGNLGVVESTPQPLYNPHYRGDYPRIDIDALETFTMDVAGGYSVQKDQIAQKREQLKELTVDKLGGIQQRRYAKNEQSQESRASGLGRTGNQKYDSYEVD